MVELGRLEAFSEAAVANCPTLKSWEMAATESELKDVIEKVTEWPLLVTVLPDSVGDDKGYDNVAEKNSAFYLVLEPMQEKHSRAERMDSWKRTQQGMKELKEFIHKSIEGEFHDLFSDIDFADRKTEPEYNVLNWNGWSLLFTYSTDWF